MSKKTTHIAILGANREGLSLLPFILNDDSAKLSVIADPNSHAMLFKLRELGYRINPRFDVKVTTDIEELKRLDRLDVIINSLHYSSVERFLDAPEFKSVEKLSPLSAKLLWQIRATASKGTHDFEEPQYSALLSALREMVDVIRLTSDRNELLSDILNLAIESTKAERGSIMLTVASGDTLAMEVAKGMDEEVVRKIRVPIGEGISGKVAKEGKPLILSGKASTEEFVRLSERRDAKSALCVPLIAASGIIGVINVNSTGSEHEFTSDDLKFLTTVAGLAAEVIDRSSEYERLRIDAAKYELWKELETSLSEPRNFGLRLSAVCKRLSELITGLTCYIYIYDKERKRLHLKGASIKDTATFGLLSLAEGEALEGCIMENRKEVVLVDRITEGTLKRAHIVLPMEAAGELVGVFTGQIVSKQGLTKYNEAFLKDMTTLIAEKVHYHKQNEEQLSFSQQMCKVDEAGLEVISNKSPGLLPGLIASSASKILSAKGARVRFDEKGFEDFALTGSYGLERSDALTEFDEVEKETVREVLRRKDVVIRELSAKASTYVRGVIAAPIYFEDVIRGVITLFNKSNKQSPLSYGFAVSDADVLSRFIIYVEKAAPEILKTWQPKFDFGVESPSVFMHRVDEVVANSRSEPFKSSRVALLAVRTDSLYGINSEKKRDFVGRLLAFIDKEIGAFDKVAMLDGETIGIFYPEAAEGFTESLGRVFGSMAQDHFREDIFYGYALPPEDGNAVEKLLARALVRLDDNMRHASVG